MAPIVGRRAFLPFRRLALCRDGSAGMEFTFVAPLMLVLLFGTYEGCQLVRAHMRVDNAVESVAKMVAQQAAVTPAILQNFCNGAQLVMQPFAAASLSLSIASVTNDAGSVREDWEYDSACPGAVNTLGAASAVSLATSDYVTKVPNAGDSVILLSGSYRYTPAVTYVLGGGMSLTHTAFSRPRGNAAITCSGC